MDSDDNGEIDEGEFVKAVKGLGGAFEPLEEMDVKRIFAMADEDWNGVIDFNEFKSWVSCTKEFITYFKLLDQDDNGFIEMSEWQAAASNINPNWTSEEREQIFLSADTDGNGSIDFAEFMQWMVGPKKKKGIRGWISRKFKALFR